MPDLQNLHQINDSFWSSARAIDFARANIPFLLSPFAAALWPNYDRLSGTFWIWSKLLKPTFNQLWRALAQSFVIKRRQGERKFLEWNDTLH